MTRIRRRWKAPRADLFGTLICPLASLSAVHYSVPALVPLGTDRQGWEDGVWSIGTSLTLGRMEKVCFQGVVLLEALALIIWVSYAPSGNSFLL